MSSKWNSDEEDKFGVGDASTETPNVPPSEQKDRGGRRPRRPRPGDGDSPMDDGKDDNQKPSVKTVAGGWGLDSTGFTNSDAQLKSAINKAAKPAEQKRSKGGSPRAARRPHFDNDETEILVIPDLEDDIEEDIISKVAVAPKNTTRRVPTLRELDEDLKYSVPPASDGLDMGLLTNTLVPPEMLQEDDSLWDFDSLLQVVTQEFNEEKRSTAASKGYMDILRGVSESSIALAGLSSRLQGGTRSGRTLVA